MEKTIPELTGILCIDDDLQRMSVVEHCLDPRSVVLDAQWALAQLRVIDDVTRFDVHRRLMQTFCRRSKARPSSWT